MAKMAFSLEEAPCGSTGFFTVPSSLMTFYETIILTQTGKNRGFGATGRLSVRVQILPKSGLRLGNLDR